MVCGGKGGQKIKQENKKVDPVINFSGKGKRPFTCVSKKILVKERIAFNDKVLKSKYSKEPAKTPELDYKSIAIWSAIGFFLDDTTFYNLSLIHI